MNLFSKLSLLFVLFYLPFKEVHCQTANKTNNNPKESFTLQKSNPWQEFSTSYLSTTNSDTLTYDFKLLNQNTQYGSFIISNSNKFDQNISFTFDNNKNKSVDLFEVKQVTTTTNITSSDPLQPIESAVYLPSSSSKLFVFKIKSNNLGKISSKIVIDNGSSKKVITINTNTISYNAKLEDLNAVNWAYLDYPMLINRKNEITEDLYNHHINTFVIRPTSLPQIGNNDFSKLIEYLSPLKGIKNILIFANYNIEKNKIPVNNARFLSNEWKKLFKEWYGNMLSSLKKAGYTSQNIYFYPYDEASIKDFKDLEAFYNWAKSEIPGFKMYATIDTTDAIMKIGPLIDVSQIARRNYLYKGIRRTGEYWVYDTKGDNSTLSPYTYYRLMSWTAYSKNFKGIGIWNYFVAGSKKAFPYTSKINEAEKNYFMIYSDNNNTIIPSRRWEAFSLGIEDYRVIKLYEKKFGKEKTMALVNKVLASQDNYDLADEIRNNMINSL